MRRCLHGSIWQWATLTSGRWSRCGHSLAVAVAAHSWPGRYGQRRRGGTDIGWALYLEHVPVSDTVAPAGCRFQAPFRPSSCPCPAVLRHKATTLGSTAVNYANKRQWTTAFVLPSIRRFCPSLVLFTRMTCKIESAHAHYSLLKLFVCNKRRPLLSPAFGLSCSIRRTPGRPPFVLNSENDILCD